MLIVDRIESKEDGTKIVVIDNDSIMMNVSYDNCDELIKAGDVVKMVSGKYVVDSEATESRSNKIKTLFASLFEE